MAGEEKDIGFFQLFLHLIVGHTTQQPHIFRNFPILCIRRQLTHQQKLHLRAAQRRIVQLPGALCHFHTTHIDGCLQLGAYLGLG